MTINYKENFRFSVLKTDIVFGFGVLEQLPKLLEELGSSKVLIVSDPGLVKAGLVQKVTQVLKTGNTKYSVFGEVPQDSSSETINKALSLLKQENCDSVIGLGGGSSLDAGKAVAAAATNSKPIIEYAGLDKLEKRGLPVIAIPTTAGTGSEVSYWAIMTNDETKIKIAVGGELVYPDIALCDPELTLHLPPFFTATTGIDALTHAMESYTNKSYQPISDIFTYRAIELIGQYLARAVKNGEDREARYGMMLGSTMAGIGMNPTRLGIVHALAMPLGSWELKIAHGSGNAVLLPHVMEFNLDANPKIYASVARALGEKIDGLDDITAGKKAIEKVKAINKEIGIPEGLSELGLNEEMIPKVCKAAMGSGNIKVNPRESVQGELEEICRKAL